MQQTDAYERFADADGLILHSSSHRTYEGRGQITSRVRKVLHFKSRDQRGRAVASISISNKSQRIRDFDAWLVYPSGRVESFKTRDLVMFAGGADALVSEEEVMVLDRSDSVRADTVFAYEYTLSEKSIFLQTLWVFQDTLPTVYSEFKLSLPSGWRAEGHQMNRGEVESRIEGSDYAWISRNLPAVKIEDSRPPADLLFALVGVTLVPPAKGAGYQTAGDFRSWSQVAGYGDAVQNESLPFDESIAAKARELAAGKDSKWDIVQAICEYVQSVNYLRLSLDRNRGGGYKPRAAADVFETHYGDCKDMSVLARSMLSSLGIKSFAALANVGGQGYVHDAWPSPFQFNHCIVSIPMEEGTNGRDSLGIVEDPAHGKTLIFDPTQRFTPVGELPRSLQGTKVLICGDGTEKLTQLPLADARRDRLEREIIVEIDQRGSLVGTIVETSHGSIADSVRAVHWLSSEEDFRGLIRSWIAAGTREASVEEVEVEDDLERNAFNLRVKFSAKGYARAVSGDRVALSPIFLGRRTWVRPDDQERQSEYVTFSWSLDESTEFTLPEAYSLEFAPKPFSTEAEWGSYSLAVADEGELVRVDRLLSSEYSVVSPQRYEEVVDYFENIARRDKRPIILKLRSGDS